MDARRSLPRLPFAALLALLPFPASAAAQGPVAVASVIPPNNAEALPAARVTLTFSAAVDPATVNAQTIRVWGRWSGGAPGTLSLDATGTTLSFSPARPYFPAEFVSVLVSSGLHAATGAPLPGGFFSVFRVRPAPASGTFSLAQTILFRLPGEGPIRTYGFNAGDVNGDGAPDMSATNEIANDVRLLLNDGCGSFGPIVVHALPPGSEPSPNEGADFNGDGWLDLATGNQLGNSMSVLLGNGSGGYAPATTYASGSTTTGLAVLDAEGDGDMDVVTANMATGNLALHLNLGTGTFAPATFFNGGGSGEHSVAVADANGDGKPDLFVANLASGQASLLLGNGAGVFTQSALVACGGNPWMIAVGDLDGDGDADAAVANQGQANAGVLFGNGAGGLTFATTYAAGITPVAVDLADLDGDGDLDLSISNYSSGNFTVYRNDGAGVFVNPFTLTTTAAGSCTVLVDYDRDGDTDILAVDEIDDTCRIYRQVGPSPGGVQPAACTATLRVNNWANRAGFGVTPSTPVPVGSTLFLGVTGGASVPFVLALGIGVAPGAALPFGLLNLSLLPPPIVFFDGFAGAPGGTTNLAGEGLVPVSIPPSTPAGASIALQGGVLDGTIGAGIRLTNPETVLFTP
ncbi:MAG TPA: FG-GAP-like repeat-containing protein [Planctomycetota bacterium]|jgi:hypothetical protein|nr:FG-GAP-like repeat-containing protein [Planctomycetota bacterium]